MGLISSTIPNLVNGVSQQPYALRLASQAQEQINGYSSVVEGLRKRPATEHIARIAGVSGSAGIHTINRDSNEQYVVLVQSGSLRVFDIDGNEKTVNFPDGTAYLTSANPDSDFRFVTVADYTFVLNTQVVTGKGTSTTPARDPEALVWVRQGSYGATYKVHVDGVQQASYTAPNGDQATQAPQVTTDYIAEQLRSQLAANIGSTFSIDRYGSTMWIRKQDGSDFSISTDDSIGDNGLHVIKGKTQRFSDLPARAVNGFTVEIAGDQTSSFDNYYVTYDTTDTGEYDGVWTETVKGGELDSLDATTMPHALVREADGTFTFKVLGWSTRSVGDLDSNPFPSYIGRKLNDVFFHRNRLGFISDENIVLSRAGDYFNFFIGTATTVLDDDPIDIGVSHTKVSILRHAIPFNESLMLFSDQTQFQLAASDLLTPNTVAVNQTTEYECSLRAKPVGIGRYVYFAVNRGTFTGLREYYVDGDTKAAEAAEITGHVPKYIPGGVFKIAACGNEDTLAVLSDQAPNTVFTYKFFWSGADKLQAAWSKWEFEPDDKVLNCDFIESRMYLIIERADGLHLEVINLEPGSVEAGWDIHVHLDSKLNESQVTKTFVENDPALEGDNQTTVELPYKATDTSILKLVTAPGGTRVPGRIITSFTVDNSGANTVLTLSGDWTTQPFFIGKDYQFRYRFSTFVIKEQAPGGGQMTIGEGRIQLRKAAVLYNNTGFFRVEVTPFRRDTYKYTFSGRVVGSGNNILGKVSIEEGRFGFPVMSKNDQVTIEIINDTFLPCFFLSAEWEAYYTIRSQRI